MSDVIREYLEEHHPEHLNGYENGWLKIEAIELGDHTFYHIYSYDEIIGTAIDW